MNLTSGMTDLKVLKDQSIGYSLNQSVSILCGLSNKQQLRGPQRGETVKN